MAEVSAEGGEVSAGGGAEGSAEASAEASAEPSAEAGLAKRCPACLSTSRADVLTVRENMFGINAVFDYAVCAACGSLALLSVPEDMATYYPASYYSVELDPERALGATGVRQFAQLVISSVLWGRGRFASIATAVIPSRQLRTFVSILRSVRRAGLVNAKRTRVLDVGCGSGILVFALGLGGVTDVLGVDPFLAGDRDLRTGGQLRRQDLSGVQGKYDLIMFHHSFEHVPDPEASLRKALGLLAPRGRVLIRMPTPSSNAFQTYGPAWAQLDAPRHLAVLSRQGLAGLCERLGAEVISADDDSTGFQFWGSEQYLCDIPLMAARSVMVSPRGATFSRARLRAWEKQAQALNKAGRGDQSAWVIVPSRY
jgi:2-polyprenyl-3-methyl-5-hydroxy-6-metoxy-1,4-benzoquinol methylase